MTEVESHVASPHRRTVLTAAAWALPAVGLAIATQLAAASTGEITVALTGSISNAGPFRLMPNTGTITSLEPVLRPTHVTITNGTDTVLSEAVSMQFVFPRPNPTYPDRGRARGFGVGAINGTLTTNSATTAVYRSAPVVGQFGFPQTTTTVTVNVTVPAHGSLDIPLTFGLSGVSTGETITTATTFGISLNVTIQGELKTANSSLTVPVDAGIL